MPSDTTMTMMRAVFAAHVVAAGGGGGALLWVVVLSFVIPWRWLVSGS